MRGNFKICTPNENLTIWWKLKKEFKLETSNLISFGTIYVVDPAQAMVRDTIDNTRRRIESAAAHAVISASDTIDFQFLLLMQDN